MTEDIENRIVIGGYGGKGGSPRVPHEVPEGVNSTTGISSVSGSELDLSDTKIEVIDLWCEGEVLGPVTGKYSYSGNLNEIGWRTATFNPNSIALGTSGVRWLQSVYWDDTPVAGEDGKFNFQQVVLNYTVGLPNGSDVSDSIVDELSITRIISERLRGGGEEFAKIYRILNKDCIGANINVAVSQLTQQSANPKKLGDILQTSIDYVIYYRAVFSNKSAGNFILGKSETITGKITAGYIRSSKINFNANYSDDVGFLGWEIKIVRTTEDSTTSTLRNQSFVDSITEIYGNKYIYPDSALMTALFDAEFFSQIPSRKFLVNLIKVKVPNNYNPIKKTYEESSPWDGTFKTDNDGKILKEWTDNPVWCYYDLLTNKRYGLGLYIDEDLIDKVTLYEIAKYCDTLVSDGYGGLEPRFTCNLYITSQDEAKKVIDSMASVFRGITYYSAGLIYAAQDAERNPIYQFTNANVTNGDFTYTSSAKKARHTVAIVRYNDKTNFYKPAIEYVDHVDGVRKYGIRDVEVPAFGCTSRGQAIRLGRWALLTESLESESITFETSMEASFLRPGDVFQIFDSNRKTQRLGGRLSNIVVSNNQTNVTLDYPVTGLGDSTNYKFSLLTPSFYYDSSLVTGLTTNDSDNIRRTQLQSLSFSGTQLYVSGGKSMINFNQALDYTNYNVSGNFIWMIEASGDISLGSVKSDEWDTYRVLNIKETEAHLFQIEGLQYDVDKFRQIESGFSFTTNQPVNSYTIPNGPTNLQLYTENLSSNSQLIHFSFIPPLDVSNISNFRVLLKNSAFIAGDENNTNYLIEQLPNNVISGTYFPTQNDNYIFRVYSVSTQNILSTVYAENSINISNINPLKDISISSLQITTGDLLISNPGLRSSGIYDTDSPNFSWQIGLNGISSANALSDVQYRITARAPSNNNIPSNNIYFQTTGYKSQESNFTFEFLDNFNTLSNLNVHGPFRAYDLVVEAMDSGGFSSAGGNFINNVNQDADYSNAQGYDILYANNPRPTAINLFTGSTSDAFYQTGDATQQWITADGEVKIYFARSGQTVDLSTFFGDDIIGGVIYYSDLPFTQEEAKSQVPLSPPTKIINATQFSVNTNPVTVALGLFDVPRQYISVAPYDSFDNAEASFQENFLLTGLNVSNVVLLKNNSNINSYKAWVQFELGDYKDVNNHTRWGLLNTWLPTSFGVSDVENTQVTENNKLYTRGVITFEKPFDSDNYGIVTTSHLVLGSRTSYPLPNSVNTLDFALNSPNILFKDNGEIHVGDLTKLFLQSNAGGNSIDDLKLYFDNVRVQCFVGILLN